LILFIDMSTQNKTTETESFHRRLRIGDWHFDDRKDAISSVIGLGSCIALALYDPVRHYGILSHLMLPKRLDEFISDSLDLRYIEDAVPFLVEMMRINGSKKIVAKAVGGATLFKELISPKKITIGQRNTASLIKALEKEHIPIVASDFDKEHGRTITFYHHDGILLVKSYKLGSMEI